MLAACFALIDDETDKSTFRKLYDKLEQSLYVFSMNILHDPVLSEDAVSETFLTLAKNFNRVSSFDNDDMKAYAIIVNRNVCLDIADKESRYVSGAYLEDESGYIDEDIERLIVADSISRLPDIYRDVVVLKFYYGFQCAEIARMFHLNVGSVRARLNRAYKLLRKDMTDDD